MAGINIDVDSLKDFRNDLLNLSEDLQAQLKRTDAVIEEVAAEWNDPQFKKFNEEFQQDKEMIKPLCERIEDFESIVLRPFEDKIREGYLGL